MGKVCKGNWNGGTGAMIVSDCCGAEAGEFLDIEICPDCREHCEFVESEEGEESE